MNSFKKRLTSICVNLIFILGLGGVSSYATTTDISNVTDDNTSGTTTNISVSKEVITTKNTTTKNTIGTSSFNIVVSNDDMYTGLDTLLNSYVPVEISTETKTLLTKELTSLIISVVTGNASYTLETFKQLFIEILVKYGIEITDNLVEALDKYVAHYLDEQFEQNETYIMLNSIYVSLGFIIVLLIALWQGGGSFR